MNPTIENFMQRPMSHKIGAGVGMVLLLVVIYWQWFFNATNEELTKLQEQVETLRTTKTQEERIARNLPKLKREVEELKVRLNVALKELPDSREIPNLLESVSNLARSVELDVELFRSLPENFKEFYAEVPVSMIVHGTFHQVATFFDEVGHLPRIVNISQIKVHNPNIAPAEVGITAEFLATTFRYLSEEERLKATDAGDSSRRRKR